MIPKCMSWLDAYDEPIGDIEDKVDNSTPQVLSSFKVYTPPVTYTEEVEETIGISMEVEPLDHIKLEDLGFNTCNHDIPLISREIPSVDEPKTQLLPNFLPLDEITNGNLHVGIFEEKKNFFFTDPGDGVRINPDGVARSATGKFDF
ncbi:hypothetical protein Tco_0845283 [Tanacetum coccineum]